MTDPRKPKEKQEERRKIERFAWLGPLLERRKTVPDPIEGPEDLREDLEEIEE